MKVIEMKMGWVEAAHLLLVVLENGDNAGRAYAVAEILRMARLADAALPLSVAVNNAESFVAGFEGDELQEGIDDLLASLHEAQAAVAAVAAG